MLFILLEFLRDLAVIVAAVAVAVAAWRWLAEVKDRQAATVRRIDIAERQSKLVGESAAHLNLIAADLAARRSTEQTKVERLEMKVALHQLLHATTDPFLSFTELQAALAHSDRDRPQGAPKGPELRGLLIEMLADGVIAQLDGDRYFIASEFETSDDSTPETLR